MARVTGVEPIRLKTYLSTKPLAVTPVSPLVWLFFYLVSFLFEVRAFVVFVLQPPLKLAKVFVYSHCLRDDGADAKHYNRN